MFVWNFGSYSLRFVNKSYKKLPIQKINKKTKKIYITIDLSQVHFLVRFKNVIKGM